MILSTFFAHIVSIAQQNGLSLSKAAECCLQCGVTGIDVEDAQTFDPRLNELLQAGMQISSMPVRRDFLHQPSLQDAEEVVRLAVRYKVPRILIIPGFFKPGDDKAIVQNAIEPLSHLCALAGQEGITVGMEDYDSADAPFSTTAGLHWFLEQVPTLSCIFDTGNFLFSGEDVLPAFACMKDRITSQMHCKDRALTGRPGEKPLRSLTGQDLYPCAVGQGVLSIGNMVRTLVKSGFDGVLTAEFFGSADCLGDLQASAAYLKSCLA